MSEMTRDELRDALDGAEDEVADLRAELVALSAKLSGTEKERDAERARADTLEAALAEVREKAERVRVAWSDDDIVRTDAFFADLDRALAALPADLAREHDARVRAEALEEAARDADDPRARTPIPGYHQWADWLRARAAEIRGGR